MEDIQLSSVYNFWKETKYQRDIISTWLFFLAFTVYLVGHFVSGTMLANDLPDLFSYRVTQLSGAIVFVKIFVFDMAFDKNKIKTQAIVVLLGILLWDICQRAANYNFFYYYLLAVGAKNIDGRKILKWFLVLIGMLTIIVFVMAKLQIIPGLAFGRANSPVIRYALGMIYPSDLAARVFYLLLTYVAYRRFKLNIPEYIGAIACTVFVYEVTDTRLDAALMILLLLSVLFYKYIVKILLFLKPIGISLLGMLGVFGSILASYFYHEDNLVLNLVDKVLSGRLKFGHEAFSKYNVTFLGQEIHQIGNGGIHKSFENYFYIDSSFLRTLMMNGLLCFTLLMILLIYLVSRFMDQRMYSLVLFVIFVILSSIIDQHLTEISFNCLFLLTIANVDFFKDKDAFEYKKNKMIA